MRNAAFISCSNADLDRAKELENILDGAGLPAWVYTKPLTGGEFPREIVEAITTSACVILLVSPNSISSNWVEREIHFAIENNVAVVPIVISSTTPNSPLHLRIAGLSRIDATQGFVGAPLEEIQRTIRSHYKRINPIFAVMNMKGGVGKTTLAANIFASLYKDRRKNVLLIDLDPQYNLTQLLVPQKTHIADVERDRSIISAFEPGQPVGHTSPALELTRIATTAEAPVSPRDIAHRVDFDPTTKTRFDLVLGQFETAKYTLPQNLRKIDACIAHFRRFIDMARAQYDIVVIDVSPASSHLTLAAVSSATHVLAPVRPDKYSLRGLKAMRRLMDELFSIQEQPEFISIMNDISPDSPPEIEGAIRADTEFGPTMLKTVIPRSRYLLARNATVATESPFSKLAVNASGWNSTNIRNVLKDTGDEILERMKRNETAIQGHAGHTEAVQ